MPDNLIANASGEMADPVNKKGRRAHDRQGANQSGGVLGPTEQPGIPESPIQGKRKNGNWATQLGGQASPRISRRRGAR